MQNCVWYVGMAICAGLISVRTWDAAKRHFGERRVGIAAKSLWYNVWLDEEKDRDQESPENGPAHIVIPTYQRHLCNNPPSSRIVNLAYDGEVHWRDIDTHD